jgi:tRNA(Arg) A34 adenosine deaminase TadA
VKDIWDLLAKKAVHAHMVRSSRHAAAIVYKGQVLGHGLNSLKTHPIMRKYGRNADAIYLHAELDAIVRTINTYGSDILSKSTLYVGRINKKGELAYSEPCSGCKKAIKAFDIKKVYHS